MSNTSVALLAACIAVRDEWDARIAVGGGIDLGMGLCVNISGHCSVDGYVDVWALRNDIFAKWPKYSGSHTYPVPHPDFDSENETHDADDMACDAYSELPRYTGSYGALRRELLEFMIETLTSEIAQCDTN